MMTTLNMREIMDQILKLIQNLSCVVSVQIIEFKEKIFELALSKIKPIIVIQNLLIYNKGVEILKYNNIIMIQHLYYI